MNKKRFVAILAAAVMLVSAMPVYAADANVVTDGATGLEVSGSGTINDFNKAPIYQVTLPTNKSLDFIVDPHNLLDVASGQSTDFTTATGVGAILAKDDALAYIKNESSVPVVVKTVFTLDGEDDITMVTSAATDAEIASGTAANMLLCAMPSATKAQTEADYEATNQAVAIYDDAELLIKLDAAKYEVYNNGTSFTYRLKDEADNWDATAFKLDGKVNRAADWTGKSLTLSAVFTFTQATDSAVVIDDAAGIVSGTAVIDYTPIPSIYKEITLDGFGSTMKFTADSEVLTETDVANMSATVNGEAVTVYAVKGGVVSIKLNDLKAVVGAENLVDGAKFTFVISDGVNKYKCVAYYSAS